MTAPKSYKAPYWSELSTKVEQDIGLPSGFLKSIIINGERSNADQVSEAGAKTPFQIIPATRNAIKKKYGVDAYASDENAAKAAGLLLKESLDRNKGDIVLATAEYHGGTNPKNWGNKTKAYVQRVTSGLDAKALEPQSTFAKKAQALQPQDGMAKVHEAYKNGLMNEQQKAEYEADIKSGLIMLPRGETLQTKKAPVKLPESVTRAYVTGQMNETQRKELEDDIRNGIVELPSLPQSQIPNEFSNEPIPTTQGIIQRQPEPSMVDKAIGAGETALALGTGLTGGTLGMIGGTAKGLAEQILSGEIGSPQAINKLEQQAAEAMQALTYAPRTPSGQAQTQAVGEFVQDVIPPVIPLVGEAGALTQSARASVPMIEQGARKVAQPVAQVAQQARQSAGQAVSDIRGAISPEMKSANASVGGAATPETLRRVATAEGLPVPVTLTKGAATRDESQLAFEKEQIKSAELGVPLRNRADENRLQILQNFDAMVDMTGAQSPDLTITGNKVVNTLASGYQAAKTKTKVAYNKAMKSEEANAPVDLESPVTIGEGEDAITSTVTGYLNSKVTGVPTSAVTDSIRKTMVKLGLAAENETGELVPLRATVGQMENLRKEISGMAKFDDKIGLRDETIIKKIIDKSTEPVSGELFKAARKERATQARKYENRAVVARLLNNRKGMDDPQVAADQVFNKSIINSSPEEIQFLRRVILTSGKDGRQTWKELQGATINYLRDEATKGLGMDSLDRPRVSPAKLNQAIKKLDANGRLDILLGKKNAQTIRDINSVVQYVDTVPPNTLINSSGTTGTLLAAMSEMGLYGAPVASGIRYVIKLKKENATKAKINEALNALPKQKF